MDIFRCESGKHLISRVLNLKNHLIMKSIIQKFRVLPFFVLGITLVIAFSCSAEEDEPEIPVEHSNINYEVKLTKIKATDTSGEGNAENVDLEIYGELSTSLTIGTVVDTRQLWTADIANALSVGQNDTQLTGDTSFIIESNELAESSITCSGDLEEYDGNGNTQNQGQESSTFSLSSITSTQDIELTFSEPAGQIVVVTFTVTRL